MRTCDYVWFILSKLFLFFPFGFCFVLFCWFVCFFVVFFVVGGVFFLARFFQFWLSMCILQIQK